MKKFGISAEQIPDFKGLHGDTSDNIIGIKGIGEKQQQHFLLFWKY